MLLTFSYFLLQGKFCVWAYVAKSFEMFYCSEDLVEKILSGYIGHRSFIEMVKYSFSKAQFKC